MGGLKSKMPVTFWTFLIYTLAISGVPLTSGFLSKDAILAGTLAFGGLTGHLLIPIIGFLVAGLTAFYMFRIVILAFLGGHKDPHRIEHVHESPKVMTVPLMILAGLCIFVFFSVNPFSASDSWVSQAIHRPESVVPAAVAAASTEVFEESMHGVHVTAMLLSLTMAAVGIVFAFATYYYRRISADRVAERFRPLYLFLQNKWYFDEFYNGAVVGGTLVLTRVLRWFDDTVIDGAVNGAGWLTKITSLVSGKFDNVVIDGVVNATGYVSGFFGLVLRKLQTGKVQTYIVFAVLSVMVLYFVYRLI
jgi:NADH-quinone oxidoreductase subunit L